MRTRVTLVAALVGALLGPADGAAQRPGAGPRAWIPIVAVRAGWSLRDASPSVGATARLPIPVPRLRPALVAGGDLVFQDGLRERQGTVDLTVDVVGGVFAGGGLAALNTVFDDTGARETKLGYTAVAGVRGRSGRIGTQLEFRWLWVEELSPTFMMVSLNYPLFGQR